VRYVDGSAPRCDPGQGARANTPEAGHHVSDERDAELCGGSAADWPLRDVIAVPDHEDAELLYRASALAAYWAAERVQMLPVNLLRAAVARDHGAQRELRRLVIAPMPDPGGGRPPADHAGDPAAPVQPKVD
jgi:hypothetical protein